MKALKDKILSEGVAIGTEIVKVDHFLNHRIDVGFLKAVGEEFKMRFQECDINKILTVEASGIAVACFVAMSMGDIPVVFAKKTTPNTMTEGFYTAEAKSFTKGTKSVLRVSERFLDESDKVLIIDDFLAHGQASLALAEIVEAAGADVVGIGAVIEKQFQGGSRRLRDKGYIVESLAIIEKINDGNIVFA